MSKRYITVEEAVLLYPLNVVWEETPDGEIDDYHWWVSAAMAAPDPVTNKGSKFFVNVEDEGDSLSDDESTQCDHSEEAE